MSLFEIEANGGDICSGEFTDRISYYLMRNSFQIHKRWA